MDAVTLRNKVDEFNEDMSFDLERMPVVVCDTERMLYFEVDGLYVDLYGSDEHTPTIVISISQVVG